MRPQLNKDRYIVTGGLAKKQSSGRCNFTLAGRPVFSADNRLEAVHTVLPKEGIDLPDILADTKISCMFWAGQCGTCGQSGVHHRINDVPRIFFFVDEHGPPLVGTQTECCPTIRIDGGSLDQFEAMLRHHIQNGLKIQPGSVVIVSLITHLVRVGQELYWDQLVNFSHTMAELNLSVMPCLPPFPSGYDDRALMNLHQFFIRLQGCHYGNQVVSKNPRFCLWEPVLKLALDLKSEVVDLPTPHVRVRELGEDALVDCSSNFLAGFCYQDKAIWTHQIPGHVESGFLTHLMDSLREAIPALTTGKARPKIPDNDSIKLGLTRDFVDQCDTEGKTIFLVGSSILDRTAEKLIEIAEPAGVEVINLSRVGSYKTKFLGTGNDLSVILSPLQQGTAEDMVVYHLLGNEMLLKKTHYCNRNTTHLSNPRILPDTDADLLVKEMESFAHFTRSVMGFPGKILIVGPQPRHIEECCGQKKHAIQDLAKKKVDMKVYTDLFNQFVQQRINLTDNVEFIKYSTIHGNDFDAGLLEDGVHLHKDAKRTFAEWILAALNRKHSPPVPPCKNAPVFSLLLDGAKMTVQTPEPPAEMEAA